MFERLFYDAQARADARAGLAEMGRGLVWLTKWAVIVAVGLVGLAILILLGTIFNDWAVQHEAAIRWTVAGALAGWAVWLLSEIRGLLARLVQLLERAGRAP